MKRSIVLSLILAICCLLPFTASAEEWSDFFALNEETAIGYVPYQKDIDTTGLDIAPETVAELLKVDRDAWLKEADSIEEHYKKFGNELPSELRTQLNNMKAKLK